MDLIKELGLENYTEEEKNEVLVQFTDSLLKRLMARVYGNLNPSDQMEFQKLADAKDQPGIERFLAAKISDLDQIREEEVRGLVEEMADFMKAAK